MLENKLNIDFGAEIKLKAIWHIECSRCGVGIDIPVAKFKIKDDIEFIELPHFLCSKCKSVCTITVDNVRD